MDLVLTQGNDVTNFSTAQTELMRETVVSLGIPKHIVTLSKRSGSLVVYDCTLVGLCQLVNRVRATELQSQFFVCTIIYCGKIGTVYNYLVSVLVVIKTQLPDPCP
jgi:hypothetical protein